MCISNDRETICGQSYRHLRDQGTRFTFGPDCRTAIQDHIISNRLTPQIWRRSLHQLMEDMYLTGHGTGVYNLMLPKVQACVRRRIDEMVRGGIIKQALNQGVTQYTWREDADNFLHRPGWISNWSVVFGQHLGRARQHTDDPRAAAQRGAEARRAAAAALFPQAVHVEANTVIHGNVTNGRGTVRGANVSNIVNSAAGHGAGHGAEGVVQAPFVLQDDDDDADQYHDDCDDVEMTDAPAPTPPPDTPQTNNTANQRDNDHASNDAIRGGTAIANANSKTGPAAANANNNYNINHHHWCPHGWQQMAPIAQGAATNGMPPPPLPLPNPQVPPQVPQFPPEQPLVQPDTPRINTPISVSDMPSMLSSAPTTIISLETASSITPSESASSVSHSRRVGSGRSEADITTLMLEELRACSTDELCDAIDTLSGKMIGNITWAAMVDMQQADPGLYEDLVNSRDEYFRTAKLVRQVMGERLGSDEQDNSDFWWFAIF